MKKHKHGFALGKFSPGHKGHKALLKKMMDQCEFGTVVIGSAQEEQTNRIPFFLKERVQMTSNLVKTYIAKGRVKVITLKDLHDSTIHNVDLHAECWSSHVLEKIKELSFNFPVNAYYTGSEEDAKWFDYEDDLAIMIIDRKIAREKHGFKSGTELREMIYNKDSSVYKYIPRDNWKIIRRIVSPV